MRSQWQQIMTVIRVTFLLLTFPIIAGRWLGRTLAQIVCVWVLSTRDALVCPGCGAEAVLLGRWQCSWCDYVFDGFVFARCPLCRSVPPFIECQDCGTSVRNPIS